MLEGGRQPQSWDALGGPGSWVTDSLRAGPGLFMRASLHFLFWALSSTEPCTVHGWYSMQGCWMWLKHFESSSTTGQFLLNDSLLFGWLWASYWKGAGKSGQGESLSHPHFQPSDASFLPATSDLTSANWNGASKCSLGNKDFCSSGELARCWWQLLGLWSVFLMSVSLAPLNLGYRAGERRETNFVSTYLG